MNSITSIGDDSISNNILNSKRKIKGFFGFFDVLGFKNVIESNNIDYLFEVIGSFLEQIDETATSMDGADPNHQFSIPIRSMVFSDTIILYQTASSDPKGHIFSIGPSLIDVSALLLRLAFEKGLPLRGAISYGEYVVSDRYFLGLPIIEAYKMEKMCKWSGAILCDSAVQMMNTQPSSQIINYRGIENFCLDSQPFTRELIVKYPLSIKIGEKEEIREFYSLRWDDLLIIRQYLQSTIPRLNSFQDPMHIINRVQDQFSFHNKEVNDEKVKQKMENTIQFLLYCRDLPLENVRLQYIPNL